MYIERVDSVMDGHRYGSNPFHLSARIRFGSPFCNKGVWRWLGCATGIVHLIGNHVPRSCFFLKKIVFYLCLDD